MKRAEHDAAGSHVLRSLEAAYHSARSAHQSALVALNFHDPEDEPTEDELAALAAAVDFHGRTYREALEAASAALNESTGQAATHEGTSIAMTAEAQNEAHDAQTDFPPLSTEAAGAHLEYATNGAVAALCAGMVGGMVAIVRALADRGAIDVETFRADLTGLALSTGSLDTTEALALRYFRDQITSQIPTHIETFAPRAPRKGESVQ